MYLILLEYTELRKYRGKLYACQNQLYIQTTKFTDDVKCLHIYFQVTYINSVKKCTLVLVWYSVNHFWTLKPLLAKQFPCNFNSLQFQFLAISISCNFNFLQFQFLAISIPCNFCSLQFPFLADSTSSFLAFSVLCKFHTLLKFTIFLPFSFSCKFHSL